MEQSTNLEIRSSAGIARAKRNFVRLNIAIWTNHFIAYLLMVLWFHTGIDKLADLSAFGSSLSRQPIPGWSVVPLTYVVPLVEIVVGSLLIAPRTRNVGYWASVGLMSAFTLYVVLGMGGILGQLPCSCSKIITHLSWKEHLIFNVVFLLLACGGVLLEYQRRRVWFWWFLKRKFVREKRE